MNWIQIEEWSWNNSFIKNMILWLLKEQDDTRWYKMIQVNQFCYLENRYKFLIMIISC
jgi:hypothetical protein